MSLSSTAIPIGPLVLWFVLLAGKHLLGDFVLQPTWMALGKESPKGWFRPLLLHCLIHGVLASALLLALRPQLWFLGLVDFAAHMLIDRAKGALMARYRLTPNDRSFWSLFGVDQALHHVTGFAIAVVVAANGL